MQCGVIHTYVIEVNDGILVIEISTNVLLLYIIHFDQSYLVLYFNMKLHHNMLGICSGVH